MPEAAGADSVSHPALRPVLRALWNACGGDDRQLFLLLDASRIRGLGTFLKELPAEHVSLYRGAPEQELSHLAPYLAPFPLRSDLLPWIYINRSVAEAALVLVADADLESLRTHLRRFLIVVDTRPREAFFRFYDPRIIGPFLGACTPEEAVRFFGPIRTLLAFNEIPPSKEPFFFTYQRPVLTSPQRQPPTAFDKFHLRPAHEQAFADDVWKRYQKRCIVYLRGEHHQRLRSQTDDDIRSTIDRARAIGEALETPRGRDVTRLAEALVLGMTAEDARELSLLPREDRREAVMALRDRLRKPAAIKEPVRG